MNTRLLNKSPILLNNSHRYFDQILSGVNESRTLAQLRDTLLPKLISVELRIKNAEAFLKERG